jgi:hypothetical protein
MISRDEGVRFESGRRFPFSSHLGRCGQRLAGALASRLAVQPSAKWDDDFFKKDASRELLQETSFRVAVPAIEDREVGFVLPHSEPVDLRLVVPGVAVRAEGDQVVEHIVGAV